MTNSGNRLEEAIDLIEEACQTGELSTAALLVQQHDFSFVKHFGHFSGRSPVFLIASISKPMTAMGIMVLIERGQMLLSDTVRNFLPEFTGDGRDLVTIRHLLTHTSGLPDMLPENTELRKRHASQDDFVAAICQTPLLFKPGSEVRYQSMGSLLAARIAECITAIPFRKFLQFEVFVPLGMSQTSLGLGERRCSDMVMCQVCDDDDWNWNSAYWRDFGAPWGGIHSTVEDLGKFLEAFLHPKGLVLKPEIANTMIVNQTAGLNDSWGLGWMVKPGMFGHMCSARAFGHYGVSGTLAWCDPEVDLSFVLLTTKPVTKSRDGLLGLVADLVSDWGGEKNRVVVS